MAVVPLTLERPRLPKSAYMFFCEAARLSPIMACGLWAQLGTEGRAKFEMLAARDKDEYRAECCEYLKQVDPAGAWLAKHAELVPKRRTSAFFLFTQDADRRREATQALKEAGQDATMPRVSKKLGEMWRRAPQMVKSKYEERAEQSCPDHKAKMTQWRKTPEFAKATELRKEARQRKALQKQHEKEVVVGELLTWPRKEQALAAIEDTPPFRSVARPCRAQSKVKSAGCVDVEAAAAAGEDAFDAIDFRPAGKASPQEVARRHVATIRASKHGRCRVGKTPTPQRPLSFRRESGAAPDIASPTVQPRRLVFSKVHRLAKSTRVAALKGLKSPIQHPAHDHAQTYEQAPVRRRITSKGGRAAAAEIIKKRLDRKIRVVGLQPVKTGRSTLEKKKKKAKATRIACKPAVMKHRVKKAAVKVSAMKSAPKPTGKKLSAMKAPSKASAAQRTKAKATMTLPPVAWFRGEFCGKAESPGRLGWMGGEFGCRKSPLPKPVKPKKVRWLDYEFGGMSAQFEAKPIGATPAKKQALKKRKLLLKALPKKKATAKATAHARKKQGAAVIKKSKKSPRASRKNAKKTSRTARVQAGKKTRGKAAAKAKR
eukprot:TRINITY_DN123912_c0_g1_i1.p1 TRINITY_DN123912_c0_g1~~TRINITY_DN123912_c0_g1_i1.p1  ORF type:complete len:600 (+),score=104.88 TRINITY_DN123912_c0_g1_i1:122-1921(+)